VSRITDALRRAAAERDARLKESAAAEETAAAPAAPPEAAEREETPAEAAPETLVTTPAAEEPAPEPADPTTVAAVTEPVAPPVSQAVPAAPAAPPGLRHVLLAGVDERVIQQTQANSQPAEQYRVLREQLRGGAMGSPPELLVVTSADNTRSRPVATLNLALAFAEDSSISVLVVDGCVREPSFDVLLGLPAGPGLADCLAGRCEPQGVLVTWGGMDNIRVLTAGSLAGAPATQLLSSSHLGDMLGALRSEFDCILIDMPSPVQVADTRRVAPLAEGVLIIAEAGRTRREVIHRAESLLTEAKARVVGVALTDVQRAIPDFIYRHL
jgi:Mrp family chromosome partitioning ATPase